MARRRPNNKAEILKGATSDQRESIQFFRPQHIPLELHELLEREDLTDEDIVRYLTEGTLERSSGSGLEPGSQSDREVQQQSEHDPYLLQVEAYRARRIKIHELVGKLRTGGARIDEDGRLIDVDTETNGAPARQPQQPQPAQPQDDGDQPLLPLLPIDNNDEEERRWLEQEERDAAASIKRAVERYRDSGVPFERLKLVKVQRHHQAGAGANNANHPNFTFRRICFAVLAIVTAFVSIMLQTSPLWENYDETQPEGIDKIMYQLLHVRLLSEHDPELCPNLDRTRQKGGLNRFVSKLTSLVRWQSRPGNTDCSDGVLHIPPTFQNVNIDKSWFFPCKPIPRTAEALPSHPSSCYPGTLSDDENNVCKDDETTPDRPNGRCFRGIHDDFMTKKEIADALRMGSTLISMGGDHMDIHYDVTFLEAKLPSLVKKVRALLRDTYHIPASQDLNLQPVAYRVNAVGPMDGEGVPMYGLAAASHPLLRLLNRTRYLRWMHESLRHNEVVAQYYSSLPWPFRVGLSSARRDTCNLMADMAADPRFAVLTSLALNDGAGEEFRGGVSLFVDDAEDDKAFSSRHKSRKIRRGLTIDGSAGRLVVSTGGLENRRCRLPMRAGIRATLQIWWNC